MSSGIRSFLPAALAVALAASLSSALAQPQPDVSPDDRTRAGQMACIDPHTGELTSPSERPECGVRTPPLPQASDSHEGLRERLLPGGGAAVDLEGRFEQQDSTPSNNSSETNPHGQTDLHLPGSGQTAIIDPITGQLVEPPPTDRPDERTVIFESIEDQLQSLQAEQEAALSASGEDLTEEVLPDGSAIIDLQGRFQSPLFAVVNPQGKVIIDHDPESLTSRSE